MRRLLLCSLLMSSAAATCAEDETKRAHTNSLRVTTISLPDQYGHQRTFAFPQPGVSVLTVADQKGSEQIAGWVQTLKQRFPEGLPIEGVADVSRVPRLLRPLVRKRFVEKVPHPVMLDWDGKIVNQLFCKPGVANIFLLSTNGAVLMALHGEADGPKLEKLQSFWLADERSADPKTGLSSNRTPGKRPIAADRR